MLGLPRLALEPAERQDANRSVAAAARALPRRPGLRAEIFSSLALALNDERSGQASPMCSAAALAGALSGPPPWQPARCSTKTRRRGNLAAAPSARPRADNTREDPSTGALHSASTSSSSTGDPQGLSARRWPRPSPGARFDEHPTGCTSSSEGPGRAPPNYAPSRRLARKAWRRLAASARRPGGAQCVQPEVLFLALLGQSPRAPAAKPPADEPFGGQKQLPPGRVLPGQDPGTRLDYLPRGVHLQPEGSWRCPEGPYSPATVPSAAFASSGTTTLRDQDIPKEQRKRGFGATEQPNKEQCPVGRQHKFLVVISRGPLRPSPCPSCPPPRAARARGPKAAE